MLLSSLGAAVAQGVMETSNAIAFSSDRDGNLEIYVMQPDTLVQTRITHNSDHDWDPAWSPDHSKIAFESDRDGKEQIWVMNANGTMQGPLTPNSADGDGDPAWSPDGISLAFTSMREGGQEIWVVNADGTLTRLTNNEAGDERPRLVARRDQDRLHLLARRQR